MQYTFCSSLVQLQTSVSDDNCWPFNTSNFWNFRTVRKLLTNREFQAHQVVVIQEEIVISGLTLWIRLFINKYLIEFIVDLFGMNDFPSHPRIWGAWLYALIELFCIFVYMENHWPPLIFGAIMMSAQPSSVKKSIRHLRNWTDDTILLLLNDCTQENETLHAKTRYQKLPIAG